MLRPPPRSTRTATLFPYPTLFRSLPTAIPSHDFRVRVGPDTAQPYDASVFNISAMSFGSLSANPIRALNAGAKRGNFYHDTGEGSISSYHRENSGDLVWEIGSGYFGCRSETRRVGKDWVRTCRSRWLPFHSNKKKKQDSMQGVMDTEVD